MRFSPILACICIFWASAGMADRHCASSSEQYYAARQVLLKVGTDVEQDVKKALANLRSSQTEAAICGCPDIRDVLDDLQQQVSDPEMTSRMVASAILAAQDAVDAAITRCH